MRQRTKIVLSVGNTLELAGAGIGCYAVADLVGVGWALLLAGILIVVAAEFIYDGTALRFELPQPIVAARRLAFKGRARLVPVKRRWRRLVERG